MAGRVQNFNAFGLGFGAGALSGFSGIGGGVLIVPGLILATGMPIVYAVGWSLVAVTAFGLTTAGNYAISGRTDGASLQSRVRQFAA